MVLVTLNELAPNETTPRISLKGNAAAQKTNASRQRPDSNAMKAHTCQHLKTEPATLQFQ